MSASLFETLPLTKGKVTAAITILKDMYDRDPTENEVATYLNISREELQNFIKPTISETRYYGSSLAKHNRPSGSPFDDPLRYDRRPYGYSHTNDALLNDPEKQGILADLKKSTKKMGGRKITVNKIKKKHQKSINRRYSKKKNRKSMRRK